MCRRLDGIDPLIMVGTGSHAGHVASAMWIDDELFVVETLDEPRWPVKGVQKHTYIEWLELAKANSYDVAWLPLS